MAELNLIYFKELPLEEQNEFSANLSESNEIVEFFLRKSNKHLLTNLKIDYEPPPTDLENKNKIENEKFEKYVLRAIKELNKKKLDLRLEFKDLYSSGQINFIKEKV